MDGVFHSAWWGPNGWPSHWGGEDDGEKGVQVKIHCDDGGYHEIDILEPEKSKATRIVIKIFIWSLDFNNGSSVTESDGGRKDIVS